MKRDSKLSSSMIYLNNAQQQQQQQQAQSSQQQQQPLVVSEIRHRTGTVLDSSTLIKVDDYLFKQQKSKPTWFPRRISGAEELRIAEGTSIIGVAQPSLPGVRGILDSLNAGRNVVPSSFDSGAYVNRKKVLWINLREEPLLYLNGRPVVLREREEPFKNMETFRGINESRLRELEWRFKEDVVAEAQRCGGSVLLHEEEGENTLVEKWESAPPSAVMTAEDVFFQLRQEGYRVRYERLPCTSGLSPSPGFFDELLRFVSTTDRDTWVVFNCQSGNARSTLAMVATYAIQTRRGFWNINADETLPRFEEALSPDRKRMTKKEAFEEPGVPVVVPAPTPPLMPALSLNGAPPPPSSPAIPDEQKDETARQLLAGWYLPILQLLRLLVGGGREAKSRMDTIIDRCSHTSNLRAEVLRFRAKAANSREKSYRSLYILRASVALQRYMLLILFESYLEDRASREGRALTRVTSNSHAGASPAPNKGNPILEELGHGGSFGSSTDLEGLLTPVLKSTLKHSRTVSRDVFASIFVEPVTFSPDYRPTFQEWLETRKEILTLLKSVRTSPEDALDADTKDYLGPEVGSSESLRVLQSRRGVMLNTDTILKLDDFENFPTVPGSVPESADNKGGRNFRRVPGMRVYGVATPAVFNAKALIRVIQTTHGAERLLFCNLREEPFVYINEKPFVLRSVHRPFRNINAFADIDVARLEKAEQRLKQEILSEAARFNGKILVHTEAADGSLKVIWEDVEDDEAVQTPKDMFASLSADEILPVSYVRIPMTPEAEPGLSDIDDVLQTVRKSKGEPGTHFVFFCQRGRGRSTIATILACLELDEFFPTDDSESLSLMRGALASNATAVPEALVMSETETLAALGSDTGPKETGLSRMPQKSSSAHDELASFHTDFPPMLALMRVLRYGAMAKRWLDFTVDRCGEVFNLRKSILAESIEAPSARTEEQSTAIIESALFDLRRYFILLEVAGYCMEMKAGDGPNVTTSFKHWCAARPELLTLKEDIHDRRALAVMAPGQDNVVAPSVVMSDIDTIEMGSDGSAPGISDRVVVTNRRGRVLVRGSILKTDHFPGCRRLTDAKVEIDGAPNFRSVWPEGRLDDIDLRVYGTGIPTDSALNEILRMLCASSEKQEIIWINLREEPILYLNGRPFVLRRLDAPFANLEHTGISRSRVEEMETRFKEDVLEEAASNPDYSVLIHEEDETGGLKPKWEKVESVFTSRELFDRHKVQHDVKYWRIPITDEQSPKPTAFDAIVDIVAMSKSSSHIVFNCQMGRGRTTTGLVVACATRLRMIGALRRFANVVDTKVAPNRKFRSKVRAKASGLAPNVGKELRGDYLAIMAQIRLMDDGVDAKRAMDALIDVCDTMQNLREAIHEVKVRSTKVDLTPSLRAEALSVAEHYLKRYAHLVQFAAYLLSSEEFGQKRIKFATWLKSRPELGNALKSLIGEGKKSLLSS